MYKTLVAYFSATGATKRLAERIANTLNADNIAFLLKFILDLTSGY